MSGYLTTASALSWPVYHAGGMADPDPLPAVIGNLCCTGARIISCVDVGDEYDPIYVLPDGWTDDISIVGSIYPDSPAICAECDGSGCGWSEDDEAYDDCPCCAGTGRRDA